MAMRTPSHPGRVLRTTCLEPLGLSVTEAARILGVSRQALNNVVNEASVMSAEMALRVTRAFGGDAMTWLALQAAHDLARLRGDASIRDVRRHRAAPARARLTPPGPAPATRVAAARASGRTARRAPAA